MVTLQLCRWMFSHTTTLQQTTVMQYDITLTYSIFTFSDRTLSAIKYRILPHQKTRSRHIKCANTTPYQRLKTSQIIHLLGLNKSSEYLLLQAGLAWSNELGDFEGVATLRLNFRLESFVSRQYLWMLDREWLWS